MRWRKLKLSLYTNKFKRKQLAVLPVLKKIYYSSNNDANCYIICYRNMWKWREVVKRCCCFLLILIVLCVCPLHQHVQYVNCVQQHRPNNTQPQQQRDVNEINISTVQLNNLTVAIGEVGAPKRSNSVLQARQQTGRSADMIELQHNSLFSYVNDSLIVFTNYVYKIQHKNTAATTATPTVESSRSAIHNRANAENIGYNNDDMDKSDTNDRIYSRKENEHDIETMLPNKFTEADDSAKLMRLVMDGLHMQHLPDMSKLNISQEEYARKYREYLQRLNDRKLSETQQNNDNVVNINSFADAKEKHNGQSRVLYFAYVNAVAYAINNASISEPSPNLRRKRNLNQQNPTSASPLSFFYSTTVETTTTTATVRNSKSLTGRNPGKFKLILNFPLHALNTNGNALHSDDVVEANIRMMLVQSPALAKKRQPLKYHNNKKTNNKHKTARVLCADQKPLVAQDKVGSWKPRPQQRIHLNLKVYQRLSNGRRLWLDGRKIEVVTEYKPIVGATDYGGEENVFVQPTHSQWLEFDVTKAVETWLRTPHNNLGLEVLCDNCQRFGAQILSDDSMSTTNDDTADNQLLPVLNIIGQLGQRYWQQRSRPHQYDQRAYQDNEKTQLSGGSYQQLHHNGNCKKEQQRCCRHAMEVVFKEIKGFEFIIQPKVFDAGYCYGRCPPRYNPAHHHAMLQSLVWKQHRKHVPRPCCAPSKLVELDILHVDEMDSEKLKISTWTDMRVVECACS